MLIQSYLSGDTSVNISASVEAAVATGKLAGGELLPTVRSLAAHLRVSPATVAAAYRLLRERGLIVADGRRGTRVRPAAPLSAPRAAPLPAGVTDLSDGNPDPALLPSLPRLELEQRLYGDELNDPRLIDLRGHRFIL